MPIFLVLLIVFFSPLIQGGTTHLPVFILHILVLSMLAVWLFRGIGGRKFSLKASPADPAVAAFFLLAIISLFFAPYKSMALLWLRMLLFYILFFYLARVAVSGNNRVKIAVGMVTAMGAIESAWALVQYLNGQERVTGSFFNPNMLAGYLAPILIIGVSRLIFDWGKSRTRSRTAIALACLVFGLVIVLTGSRGGVLALAAGLLVIFYKKWRLWAVFAGAALIALLLIIPNPVRERAFGKDIYSYSRAKIWKSSARMVKDHPLGVGLGNFKYYWPRYNFPVKEAIIKYGKMAGTAHGEYFQIAAEMGLAGLAAFIAGMVLFAGAARRAVEKAEDKGLAIGLAGGITAVFAHAAVDSNLHEPGIVFLLIFLAVLLLETGGEENPPRVFALPESAVRRTKIFSTALIVLLLAWTSAPPLAYFLSEKAKKEAASGDLAPALEYAEAALMLGPGDASHHNLKAALMYQASGLNPDKGRFADIMNELGEAERLNPAEVYYPSLKASLEYAFALKSAPGDRLEYLSAASRDIKRARELNPFGYDILLSEAEIRLASGDAAGAVKALEELKALEPNFLRGRVMLARLYSKMGKKKLFKDEYSNIIQIQNSLKKESLNSQERVFAYVSRKDLDELEACLESLNEK